MAKKIQYIKTNKTIKVNEGPAKIRDSIRIRIGHSDSKVMCRFEDFRIGRACPLLVVVKRL